MVPPTPDDVIYLCMASLFNCFVRGGENGKKRHLAFINVGVHSPCTCILTLLGAKQDGEFSHRAHNTRREEIRCDSEHESREKQRRFNNSNLKIGDFWLHFKGLYFLLKFFFV